MFTHNVRKPGLLVLVLLLTVLPAAAQADTFGFGAPVFVDKTLGGGEPLVAYSVKSGLLVYTSHEGTTHLFTSGVVGAPAESGGFISNYHNQVNIWTSANDGKTWTLVPFGSSTNPFATGFSDPDLTQDANGNIYDTGIDLANDALFSSQNGGKTWPTGTPQCHEGDRPWLAGGGPNTVFLSTDTEEAGHEFFESTDAGASCSSNAIPDNGSTPGGGSYNGQGKPFYDRTRGSLVEPLWYYNSNGQIDGVGIGILPNASTAWSNPSAKFSQVEIAKTTGYSHWPSMAIDSAGNYYMVWDTDDRDTKTANGCPATYSGSESFGSIPPVNAPTPLANKVMMSYSTDGGHTWSTPQAVAYYPGHRLLWPWVVAGSAGRIGLTWYEYDSVVDPDCAPSTAKVSVMAAELTNADSSSPHEVVADAAGRPIHVGSICAGGTTCAADNVITGEDRRLGDFFTDAVDSNGCLMLATGDTTIPDPITGGESPISHPLFLHQDSGTSLTGQPCGTASSTGTGKTKATKAHHKKKQHHKARRRRRKISRRARNPRGFTGRASSTRR
jgi:hypothetical protein